jgi:hypothetical protein
VSRAIEEPIRMIVQNAGGEGSIVIEKVRNSKDANYGYNALTDSYENLVEAGVIDPTKVTRTALQNAASIAGLLLTTEALIVEKKEPSNNNNAGGGGRQAAWAGCTRRQQKRRGVARAAPLFCLLRANATLQLRPRLQHSAAATLWSFPLSAGVITVLV